MAITNSPLRYPGGKSSITPFLKEVIRLNDLTGGVYIEPYAGGAGAALNLLFDGIVKRIVINDFDPCVYSFWKAILHYTDDFIKRIDSIQLNISEWHNQKNILINSSQHTLFDVGFATFYLNRCNRSGILMAGPIGGLQQKGQYPISARFNKKALIDKISRIAQFKNNIDVYNLDALELIKYIVPSFKDNVLIYLDPPYYEKGSQLYLNAYTHQNHASLANLLINEQKNRAWVLTYDDTKEVRHLYHSDWVGTYNLNYFAHHAKKGNELVIAPPQVILPAEVSIKYGLNQSSSSRHISTIG